MAAKEDILLRLLAHLPLVTKGSAISEQEYDTTLIAIYESLVEASTSSYVDAYSAATTYDNTTNNYSVFSGQLWKMIKATPVINITPGTNAATWKRVYGSDLSHKKTTLEKRIEISSTQWKSGTPITAITSPGIGKAIEVITSSMSLIYGSTPFDVGDTVEIFIDTLTNSQHQIAGVKSTADAFHKGWVPANDTICYKEDETLLIKPDSTPSTGDSDIVVYITYRIINL